MQDAPGFAGLRGLNPQDITFRRCYYYKPMTWNRYHSSWDGYGPAATLNIKNLAELKKGVRVLWEDCVFDGMWDGQQAFPLNFKKANQDGGDRLVRTCDIVVRHVDARNVCNFLTWPNDGGYRAFDTPQTARCAVVNARALGLGRTDLGTGEVNHVGTFMRQLGSDVSLRQCVSFPTRSGIEWNVHPIWLRRASMGTNVIDCVFGSSGSDGFHRNSSGTGGSPLNFSGMAPDTIFRRNGIVSPTAIAIQNGATTNTGNVVVSTLAAAGVDPATGRVLPGGEFAQGGITGCDIDTLEARTAGCVSGVWP